MNAELEQHDELLVACAQYSADPPGFVMWAYPWGEPGSELELYDGPEDWQMEVLCDLRDGILTIREAIALAQGHEAETDPIQLATTSGHGIGKSALVSWILDWAQSTMEDTKGIVTANTEMQLKTKTWAELAKWHRLSLTSSLFKMTATARFSIDPDHEKTWRIDMIPWNEKNPEAFAGLHNKGKRIIIVFDEASNIPDIIWEVTEGAATDNNTEIIWACFGNPTRNAGRFRECFEGGKFAHRWKTRAVDSRSVSITNKSKFAKWVQDYGDDHDFVRVRVTGKFPRVDASSFISLEAAKEAAVRRLPEANPFPVVLGVDVARKGNNLSVIYPRQGRDARSRMPGVWQGLKTTELATHVFNWYIKYSAVAVFVDGGGVGGGVVDQLIDMNVPVWEVTFGGKSDNANPEEAYIKYFNKRAEIWGSMKLWLEKGCIPDEIPGIEEKFTTELAGVPYGKSQSEDVISLVRKRDLLISPDASDALACTFAYPSAIPLPESLSRAIGSPEVHTTYSNHNPIEALSKEYMQ